MMTTPEQEADSKHGLHMWEQVGLCVWCKDCSKRLYNGELPEYKRTIPVCETHDWDPDQGLGFYLICKVCKTKEWLD